MGQTDFENGRAATGNAPAAKNPKLTFACPDCGTRGWIHWAQLPRGMRCGCCKGRFWIDSSGHIRSERKASKVRFECPRCRRVEVVPKELLARGIVCLSCERRFHQGPDGQFHTQSELDKLRRQEAKARTQAQTGRPKWSERLRRPPAIGALAYRVAAALAVLVLTGLVLTGAVRLPGLLGGPATLESSVKAFTRLCIEGRTTEAAKFVCPDQQEVFQRWLTVCHAGPQPSGNSTGSARRVDRRPRIEVDGPKN